MLQKSRDRLVLDVRALGEPTGAQRLVSTVTSMAATIIDHTNRFLNLIFSTRLATDVYISSLNNPWIKVVVTERGRDLELLAEGSGLLGLEGIDGEKVSHGLPVIPAGADQGDLGKLAVSLRLPVVQILRNQVLSLSSRKAFIAVYLCWLPYSSPLSPPV